MRETEFAKLELKKEQEHKTKLGALNFQIADLQVANKRLTQRVGDVEGDVNIKEADKFGEEVGDTDDDGSAGFTNQTGLQIQEVPVPKNCPDRNQKLPDIDEEVRDPNSRVTSSAANVILAAHGCAAIPAGTIKGSQKRKGQRTLRNV